MPDESPASNQPRSFRRRIVPLVVLVVCLTGTVILWRLVEHAYQARAEDRFRDRADDVVHALSEHLRDHERLLTGVVGLFRASQEVTREEFRAYVDALRLLESHPGILGVGYSVWLTPEAKTALEHRLQREGFPSFAVTPPGDRATYTSIVFLEPFHWRNQRAFGYDMYSERVRRAAMDLARDSGAAAIAANITLVQETETQRQAGLLMYVPHYRTGAPPPSVEGRREAFVGFVYSPIRIADFVYGTLGKLPEDIGFEIYAGPSRAPDTRMFSSVEAEGRAVSASYVSHFVSTRDLSIYGTNLHLVLRTLPSFAPELRRQESGAVLAAGILLSFLLSGWVAAVVATRERALGLAAAMTRDLRESESRAESNRQHFETLVATSPVAVFETDGAGRIVMVNDHWTSVTGVDRAQARGHVFRDAVCFEDRDQVEVAWNAARGSGAPVSMEHRIAHPTRGTVWVLLQAAPLARQDGEAAGYIGTMTDVTRLKEAEELALAGRKQAEEANRAKSEFLANMSHEIRTPMNGVLGMTSLLGSTDLSAKQQGYLDKITISANNLLRVVNDILDLSKIEAGKLEVAAEPFAIRPVLRDVVGLLSAVARAKGIELRLSMDDGVPEALIGDAGRVAQIAQNLIGNAIKFTERGSVSVSLSSSATEDDCVRVTMVVTDTGIGMSGDVLEKLFRPFVQGDSSTTRRFGGTGLGLAICRRLAELMSGRIWVESDVGGGTSVSVELPFRVGREECLLPEPPPARPSTQPPARSLRVLLAEDQEINRLVGEALLSQLGHEVVFAHDGQMAVELWNKQSFDIILMDIQMPTLDGIGALREIRKSERAGSRDVPVVALTAHAMLDDGPRLRSEGFDGYLTKPVDIRALAAELDRCMAQALRRRDYAPPAEPAPHVP